MKPLRFLSKWPLALVLLAAGSSSVRADVIFNPVFGGQTIYSDSDPNTVFTTPLLGNPAALNSPTVYLIFWGTSWKHSASPWATIAGKFAFDAHSLLASPYLSGLTDYGSDGHAIYGDYCIDDSPAQPMGWDADQTELNHVLNDLRPDWTKPSGGSLKNSPIYVIVYDNGSGGANGFRYYNLAGWIPLIANDIHIGDPGNSEDNFTDLLSHELAERISEGDWNYFGDKYNDPASGNVVNGQIADGEPDGERYTWRLDGRILVQAYWSITDQAYVVPDGSPQNVVLAPIWNGSSFANQFLSMLAAGGTISCDGYGNTRVLWHTNSGAISLWNVISNLNHSAYKEYGPFGGWTPQAQSTNTYGQTRILWNRTDGRISVWAVDANLNQTSYKEYGPFGGWSAGCLCVGSDGKTRLLWNSTNGATGAGGKASLWVLDSNLNQITYREYGPFYHWWARSMCVSQDGQVRLLWDNLDGRASLWKVDANLNQQSYREYGPFYGWTPYDVSISSDMKTRLIWNNTLNGSASLWLIDESLNPLTYQAYGPFNGWTLVNP